MTKPSLSSPRNPSRCRFSPRAMCGLALFSCFFMALKLSEDSTRILEGIGDRRSLLREVHQPDLQRKDICFITFEFAAGEDMALESVQNLTDLGIRMTKAKASNGSLEGDFRYIVLTNMENYDSKDWEKVVVRLDSKKYKRTKTHTVYANFMSWKLPETRSCRTIFAMDGLFTPVNKPEVWYDLEARIQGSRDKFMVQLKPENRTVMDLLIHLPRNKKDTWKNVLRTEEWLIEQPDFDDKLVSLYTNFLAFDPTSAMYQQISESFWQVYSQETTTPRDQPLFSYFVFDRFKAQPALLHTTTPGIYETEPHVNLCRINDKIYDLQRIKRHNVTVYDLEVDESKLDCKAKEKGHDYSGLVTFPPKSFQTFDVWSTLP